MLKHLFKPKLAEGDVVAVGDHHVRLAVNHRSKRITLRVDAGRAEIIAVAPHVKLLGAAVDFAHQKQGWIATRLARLPQPTVLDLQTTVPYRGAALTLLTGAMRAHIDGDVLRVRAAPGRAGIAAIGFLKAQARVRAQARLHHYAVMVGRTVHGVRLADPKARWGSCTSDGRIMLSWRLIMAPDDVFDYVAAHEVCHLVHPDHSKAFWDLVHRVYGSADGPRSWLKHNGGRLHAVRA